MNKPGFQSQSQATTKGDNNLHMQDGSILSGSMPMADLLQTPADNSLSIAKLPHQQPQTGRRKCMSHGQKPHQDKNQVTTLPLEPSSGLTMNSQ